MMLNDVASLLEAAHVGIIGTDLFMGNHPDKPDNSVALLEYGGSPPSLSFAGGTIVEEPGLNVWIRNNAYAAGRAVAQAVFVALHGVKIGTGAGKILLIKANQSPESMGKDDNDRQEWVINFSVLKEVG